jgi:RNA polymerase sigma factor for flagellar operon FliA
MNATETFTNTSRTREDYFAEHYGLVAIAVRKFSARWPGADRHVIESAAMDALWRGAGRIDPSRSADEVSSYLRVAIDNDVIRAVTNDSPLSPSDIKFQQRLGRATEELSHRLRREPTIDEVVDEMGVDRRQATEALNRIQAALPIREHFLKTETALSGTVHDEPRSSLLEDERSAALRRAVARLPLRMRQVVESCYFDEKSFADAGREMGVSRARVTALHQEALHRLSRSARELRG